jgi:RNA polymerase sigma-70 factor (ECF subfamily)
LQRLDHTIPSAGVVYGARPRQLTVSSERKEMASREFEDELIAMLPRMRGWALAMTRNGAAADDLAQDTAAKALIACDRFMAGTNFKAWVRRIMTNHFISAMRSWRFVTDEFPDVPVQPMYIERIVLRELGLAVELLPSDQKTALFAIAVSEKSYEKVAEEFGCPVGTLKSRVHRARLQLRAHMDSERRLAA